MPTSVTGYRKTAALLFVGLAMVISLMPIYWLLITSLKVPIDYFARPPVFFPSQVTFKHYANAFSQNPLLSYVMNSTVVAFVSTAIDLFIGSLAAYGITRFKIGGKYFILWILALQMFPPISVVVPTFLLTQHFQLYDTQLALIIVYAAFNLPFATWMLNGFFKEVPLAIDDSALIDGCSRWKTYLHIVLPLTRAGLVATAIFTFIFSWNEFLFALILTATHAKTVPVDVAGYIGDKQLLWGPMAAAGTIVVAPVLVFALLVQKHLVRGMTFGAVKG